MSRSAAYFDVDGTLVGTNLVHPTILHMVNQETMLASAARLGRALLQAPAMASAEMRDRRLFNEMLFSHYRGMTEDRIVVLAEECFERVVKPRMFVGTRDLIAKCKLILAKNNGGEDPSLLASDFKFVAPVVGPLEKERFLAAFQSFKIDEGFPDAKFNYYHFRVDPFEPSRVWYDARFVGTNTGPLIGGTLPATNKKVESPPQSCSMRFNERGECTQLTVGYVMDKQLGNTGGLGGVYGILYAIGYGLPFPEAQPWQKSVQYDLFQRFSGATQELQKFVKGLTGGN